ncbi:MAG: diacylglycerol kinase family lipid kinase [Bacteroidales bacterium]|nr:diacylglycerol kinase family lipid kinase [Bacteroidales bacterium]
MQAVNYPVFTHDWEVVFNPNALSKKCYLHWQAIENKLRSIGLSYQQHVADSPKAGIQIVKKLCLQGKRHFIAVGGDGTINEVINGIFLSGVPTNEVYVVVLPLGTGNDWTRSHDYPSDYLEILNELNHAKFIKHDVGVVETMVDNKIEDKRFFINIAGFGFDAAVIQEVNKHKSKVFSKAVYLFNLLKVLLTYSSNKIKIITDDASLDEDIFTIAVGICQYNGNGMRQVPMANPVDGIFDVVIIKKIHPFKVIKNVKSLYEGTHLEALNEAVLYKTTKVEIQSGSYFAGEVEGELIYQGNYVITILPQSIHMMTMKETW